MLTRRLNRIFRPDGRAFIVAFDHGQTEGPIRGIEDPGAALSAILAGGADAILATYGTARRFAQILAPAGLILRLDGGTTSLGTMTPAGQMQTVEAALRIGADAVAVSVFPGTPEEAVGLRALATVVNEAHRWGLPVMGEMQPGGFDAPVSQRTAEAVAVAARVAAEYGADWVKVPYADGYERVIATCFVPVVMLGGSRTADPGALLQSVHTGLQAGAAGVAIGRNIFQARSPGAMSAAVARLVHGGATAAEALEILGRAEAGD
jgi:class I fructose-bisphosphate aldolase